MIEWKKVDPKNPPKGTYLFFLEGYVYTGWIINKVDDEGYPLWETSEGSTCQGVRDYADLNYPEG